MHMCWEDGGKEMIISLKAAVRNRGSAFHFLKRFHFPLASVS